MKGTNPWLSMWTKPRQTIRAIVSSNPNQRLVILSLIYALPTMLYTAQKLSLSTNYNFWVILAICAVLAIPVGFIGFCINSLFLLITGKLIKGKASFKEIRAAYAWSSVPNIINILLWVLLLITFGSSVFMANFPSMLYSGVHGAILQLGFLLQLGVSIWMLVIFLHALGQVQGFSAWMALLNVALGILLWVVVVYGIGYIIGFLSGAPQ